MTKARKAETYRGYRRNHARAMKMTWADYQTAYPINRRQGKKARRK